MSTAFRITRIKQEQVKGSKDFSLFSPRAYLQEYHCQWDDEDDFTMSFLHRAYKEIEPQSTCVEIGGGPAIHQLISARNKVRSIVFAEYLARNRFEVKKWKHNSADSFDWTPYFKHVHALEGADNRESVAQMQTTLRRKIRAFVPCDILRPAPIASLPQMTFDVVSAHFCPESITDNEEDFLLGMLHIVSLVRPNGYLLMSFLKEAHTYAVGSKTFSAYPLSESKLNETLELLGCKTLVLEHGPADGRRDYGGTMSLFAQRRPVVARSKLNSDADSGPIKTMHGLGYVFVED